MSRHHRPRDRDAAELAFDLWCAETRATALRIATYWGVPPSDVDDVVVEVFVTAWREWRTDNPVKGPLCARSPGARLAWLALVTKFRAIDGIRRTGRRAELPCGRVELDVVAPCPDSPERVVVGRDAVRWTARYLSTCSDDDRELLVADIEGIDLADLAGAKGASADALRARRGRARKRMAEAWHQHDEEEPGDDHAR